MGKFLEEEKSRYISLMETPVQGTPPLLTSTINHCSSISPVNGRFTKSWPK